jgi:hypothetical protein
MGGKPQKGEPTLAEIAGQLRAHPGQPAIIMTFPPVRAQSARSMAMNIRRGRYQAFRPPGTFDAVSRTEIEDGAGGVPRPVVNVYACYGSIEEDAGE